MDDGRVIPNFMSQAIRGESLTVYGDGSQTRSFCYIDDMVEGIYKLLMSDFYMPVNLGNPAEMTVLAFAEEIRDICSNPDLEICFKSLPVDDPLRRRPDISLAKRELDWTPKTARPEGMARTYEYFKQLLSQ